MSGRSSTEDQIIRHQQEVDLDHHAPDPADAERARAGMTGTRRLGKEDEPVAEPAERADATGPMGIKRGEGRRSR